MRVLYIGMYSDSGLEGLESSSLESVKMPLPQSQRQQVASF